ncbi:MAG: MoaD/ThiS family protein [Opitutaceae bacterium]|jgi:molybdopterin converting factor subunit 1|nr:MoaD/ThiS family protein [Opitutaceae bacterium]
MRVLYFAQARRLAGTDREEFPVPSTLSTDAFWALLLARHPALAPLRPVTRLARDEAFLPADATLAPDDEIALIPPVSGG